jgi:hypothetical protein
MENTPEQTAQTTPQPPMQQSVPYSTSVLVLGILSIVFCWCFGPPGLVLGIIALVQSNRGKEAYAQNPNLYTQASLKNLNSGRICGIIGLSLSGLYFLFFLIRIIFLGAVFTAMPWHDIFS